MNMHREKKNLKGFACEMLSQQTFISTTLFNSLNSKQDFHLHSFSSNFKIINLIYQNLKLLLCISSHEL